MLACCGLMMTRSALNRPSARILSSSSLISSRTLANTCGWPFAIVFYYRLGPVEDDLAALGTANRGEGRVKVHGIEPVRDNRRDVDARLDEDRHLVPGLEHLPSVDPLDGDHVEDQVRPVDPELLGRQPENRDLATVSHGRQHVA